MKQFFKDYFTFTRSEFRIILVLSSILFLITVTRIYTDSLVPATYKPTEEELQNIKDFILSLEKKDRGKNESEKYQGKVYFNNLMNFDPNTVITKDLKVMGFPENVISNLSAYRQSGGQFRKPEEFKKIYGISDSSFMKILPFIIIEDAFHNQPIPVYNKIIKKRINLNTADSLELISLNGIGSVFAARIIKYRNKLGGFFIPEQLLEVYGMDSLRYLTIKESVYTDSLNIRKMNINSISLTELSKHPYMDKQTAVAFIKFREFKGKITDIRELDEFNIVKGEKLKKIEPYLDFIP